MKPEIPGETQEIDTQCKQTRARVAADLELPNTEQMQQSGPFKSDEHFFESSFKNFKELLYYTSLAPTHRVLDYGCGVGRLAIPLSAYLDGDKGSYCGVDTNAGCISRNAKAFSRYQNFKFEHTNIYSKRYNRQGGRMKELRKLDLGDQFDLAVLFSVFTHVLPNDCDYLLKFLKSRLLTSGEVFCSWFLINDETQKAIDAGQSGRNFEHHHGAARIENPEVPEAAVAYNEQDVLDRFKKAGFSDVRVHYGLWRGCVKSWLYQDVIVARAS